MKSKVFTIVATIASLTLLFFGGLFIVAIGCFIVPALTGRLKR